MEHTLFLVTRPSFFNGIARTIDLFAGFTEYNISPSNEIADSRALFNDVRAVYDDINISFRQLKAQSQE